jgi:hypothetical protein
MLDCVKLQVITCLLMDCGFIACFSTDYFCTMCLATPDEIQYKTFESQFCMRDTCNDMADVQKVLTMTARIHSHGVKMTF